jgi:hypothetical protein
LDECLASGAFRQSDPDCRDHVPASGSTFGWISSVVRHPVQPGEEVTLAIEGVDDLSFDRPILCGEEGCLYHRISWRVEDRAAGEVVRGCGDRDATCTIRVWPRRFVGDEAERWTVVYGEHFAGRRSASGVAHAIYMPPRYYPVTLDARTPEGALVPHEPGSVAYAVRAGASPTAAECAPEPWVWSRRFDLTTRDPRGPSGGDRRQPAVQRLPAGGHR